MNLKTIELNSSVVDSVTSGQDFYVAQMNKMVLVFN